MCDLLINLKVKYYRLGGKCMLLSKRHTYKSGITAAQVKRFTLMRHGLNTIIAIGDKSGLITYNELYALMLRLREVLTDQEQLILVGNVINVVTDAINCDAKVANWDKEIEKNLNRLRAEFVLELRDVFSQTVVPEKELTTPR